MCLIDCQVWKRMPRRIDCEGPFRNSACMWGYKWDNVIISRCELISTVHSSNCEKWKTTVQTPLMNGCAAGCCQPVYTEQTRMWWASAGQGTRTWTSLEFSLERCTILTWPWAQCWTRLPSRVLGVSFPMLVARWKLSPGGHVLFGDVCCFQKWVCFPRCCNTYLNQRSSPPATFRKIFGSF